MRRLVTAAVLTLGLSASSRPADPPEPAPLPRMLPDKIPADKFKALVKAAQQFQRDFSDAYQAAKTDDERKKVSKELGDKSRPDYHAGSFLSLINEYPKDPTALDAARWLLNHAPYGTEADQAVDVVLRDWIADPRLKDFCAAMYHTTPTSDRLLRAVIAKSSDRGAQGFAHFTLAQSLKKSADRLADHPAAEREPLEKQADELLQKVIDRYADLKHFTTLGEEAEQLRFELRNLGVGKTPPDIEGEGLDGKKLKLSDYRGKVTLVVFWAGWCGPCMGDVPHELELLKRYKDKPFAIVGVNADKDPAGGKAAGEKAGVSWRSFADCKNGSGPIVKRWNVSSWPTLYLLDEKGTIRFKGEYLRTVSARTGKDGKVEQYSFLDDAVELLMKEVEKKP